jgi:hypothetical protein
MMTRFNSVVSPYNVTQFNAYANHHPYNEYPSSSFSAQLPHYGNTPSNCFPIFGQTTNHTEEFRRLAEAEFQTTSHYPASHHFYRQTNHQTGGSGNALQTVLSQLWNNRNEMPDAYSEGVYSERHPQVSGHHDVTKAVGTTSHSSVKRHRSLVGSTASSTTKKADLPKGVTPLSYSALMKHKTYRTEAVEAVKGWQAYLTSYQKQLDTKAGRSKWIYGAVNYLALLNDTKVRDYFMQYQPKLIGAYYNQVLRTIRNNDNVRATMKKTPQYAEVLAIVDKTNKAIFDHQIFKTRA